ncbi:LADA_0H08460g1_1 [Lachancea dasiensis]|uniref:LADA_0H08460g1_1 n=1 Tax=Lachancea dasiensis TaxID=1072105 RepID=A0A1G4K2J6_9SACH|nr:LADA_0H08460g1_1 [Lachancea dasiensis]
MALSNTIRTHVFGFGVLRENDCSFWPLELIIKIMSLVQYLVIYNFWSYKTWLVRQSVESKFALHVIGIAGRICLWCPILGKHLASSLDTSVACIKCKVVPRMNDFEQFLETLFQLLLVELTFKGNNIRIIRTGEPFEFDHTDTTLMMANHRSIMDYTLLNFLAQDHILAGKQELSWSCFYQLLNFPLTIPFKFISWGSISNMPSVRFLSRIVLRDENAAVSSNDIMNILQKRGNHTLALFPEVNVMTPELRLVQRKLTKESYMPVLNNVLYPRFKNFTSSIRCFARLQHVEKLHRDRYLRKAFIRANGMVSKLRHSRTKVGATELAQISLFLGADEIAGDSIQVNSTPRALRNINKLNPFLWDFTILYYRAKCSSGKEHAHVHKLELYRLDDGESHYQLEQITPSFLQLLSHKFLKSPIIVRIHVKKHPLANLTRLSERKLESWLENAWIEKDSLIDSMQKNVKIN